MPFKMIADSQAQSLVTYIMIDLVAVWEKKHLLTTMRYKNFERRIQLY